MTIVRIPRRWALVSLAAAAVLGGLGGLAVAFATPAVYTATSSVFVATGATSRADLSEQPAVATGFEQQIRSSYASVATTPLVLRPVIADLHLHTTVAALARRIHVSEPAGQAVLRIDASDSSAATSVRIANAVGTRLVAEVRALTPSGPDATVSLQLVQRATVPTVSSGPSAPVLALGGALAGIAAWAVIAVVLLIVRMPRRPRGQPAPSMF